MGNAQMQLKYFTYGGGCNNANQNNGAYRLLISLNSGNTGWTVGSTYYFCDYLYQDNPKANNYPFLGGSANSWYLGNTGTFTFNGTCYPVSKSYMYGSNYSQ